MQSNPIQHKCDRCEKPATSMATDTMRHEVPGHMWVQWSPVSYIKYGCEDHPVESVEVGVTQLPPTKP